MKLLQKYIKTILAVLTLFLIVSFTIQENNVEGLTIKFRRVSEDYVIPGRTPIVPYGHLLITPILASEGMKFVKLKLTLKNEGNKDCLFDFDDVYISTEKDSLYRFYDFQGYSDSKTKIKPQKELKRIVLFEFPDNSKPKELFIEDKRYKIIED